DSSAAAGSQGATDNARIANTLNRRPGMRSPPLFGSQVYTNSGGLLQGDQHGLTTFSELWMTEHDLVGAERERQRANRRLPDLLAIDRNIRPGLSVDRERAARHFQTNIRRLVGHDLQRTPNTIPRHLVHQLEFMLSSGHHDPRYIGGSHQGAVFEDPH